MSTAHDALAERVIAALREVVPAPAELHEPDLGPREAAYVQECIASGWVSSAGAFVDRFERDLAARTGLHAVATVNGTCALHAALLLIGVAPDDEVICPALTFVATANAIRHAGAVPHFVDAERHSFGIDPERLERRLARIAERRNDRVVNRETGRRISAIVCMHVFGHPVDLDGLLRVASAWSLPLVEDAAEALGAHYRGRHVGGFGRIAALSFNGNKVVTTGGGGAILTADAELARAAKHLTTTARIKEGFEFAHDRVGYNYRMPNLNAALGCAQLERLDTFLEQKRALGERYARAFAPVSGVRFVREPEGTRSSYWLHAIVLDPEYVDARDAILAAGARAGYGLRPLWKPMHRLPMYEGVPRDELPVTEDLWRRVINLPSSARLGATGRLT